LLGSGFTYIKEDKHGKYIAFDAGGKINEEGLYLEDESIEKCAGLNTGRVTLGERGFSDLRPNPPPLALVSRIILIFGCTLVSVMAIGGSC
jgi:hypothetical protein